jgi:hypothetical protein
MQNKIFRYVQRYTGLQTFTGVVGEYKSLSDVLA